jgi:hypothetical protein
MNKRITYTLLFLVAACAGASAQRLALKENIAYAAATLTPNIAAEVGIGQRSTIDLLVGYNPWNARGSAEGDNRKIAHLLVQPEYRYWTCERFAGHFFGGHLLYARYNVGGVYIPTLFGEAYRHEGMAAGAGLSYGYHWAINAAWGVEFTLGAGVVYLEYDKYDCAHCSDFLGKFNKTYFGPTRAGISLVYILK